MRTNRPSSAHEDIYMIDIRRHIGVDKVYKISSTRMEWILVLHCATAVAQHHLNVNCEAPIRTYLIKLYNFVIRNRLTSMSDKQRLERT